MCVYLGMHVSYIDFSVHAFPDPVPSEEPTSSGTSKSGFVADGADPDSIAHTEQGVIMLPETKLRCWVSSG